MKVARGLLAVLAVLALASCSDSKKDAGGAPSTAPSAPSATPTVAESSSIPTASTPSLTPLPTPSKPWPTPTVTGAPADDAPLAERITFAIAKKTQLAAGKAATTTVKCPGIDKVETAGQHNLDCTVTYSGKPFTGTLTVDAKQYSASYKFTSPKIAIARAKVVDAVLRTAAGASKVTCDMDEIGIVVHDGPGIGCDVTTTANAVQPYRASITGDGDVVVKQA
ncbi:hypothetical protein ACFV9C_24950 [Kribbella sp. NPDC059898]|uniref:hypothetical protein n=1 Tax=Kribbella sp. NPDC059898 TaxID=3346995 RepID=UPI0036571669